MARADLPPPEGYVETCTVEQAQARTGQRCELCGDAYHAQPDACVEAFSGTSTMSKECQTSGASTWNEVWCDSAKPLSPEQKQEAETVAAQQTGAGDKGQKGCGCAAVPPGPLGGVTALMLGVGLLGLRRSRRR